MVCTPPPPCSLYQKQGKLDLLDISLTSDVYLHPAGTSFWKILTNQAATLSAIKAAKAGWIIMTFSVLSFHFFVSLEAVFYLRVLNYQNPVES